MLQRKEYAPEYKAKITIELLREESLPSEIASREGINVKQIYSWSKEFKENAALVFDRNRSERELSRKLQEISKREEELMAKVGRLTIENDWLKKKSTEITKFKHEIKSGFGYVISTAAMSASWYQ